MNNENLSQKRKRAEAESVCEGKCCNAVTREFSRHLCEIYGLPYEKEIDNELYISMCNNGDPRCTQISKKNRATLNFEKPENFVKLEEIMLKELAKERLTVVKWVHEFDGGLMHEYILITKSGHKHEFKHKGQKIDNWFVERHDRTECLILFILWKVIPICGESIKQAIKAEEWVYG